LTLAVTLSVSAAHADDLSLGGPYNSFDFYINNVITSVGGGSIQNASLNGKALAFVYCVDLFDDINVSGDYNLTTFDTSGVVSGSQVNNAGKISWLLDHGAVAAETSTDAQVALQAAIWHVIYGPNYYLDPLSTASGMYNSDLSALGTNTDPISNYDWFTPASSAGGGQLQGQVGALSPVPEPISVFLLGTVLLCLVSLAKRRFATARTEIVKK
jgi:hypothetical protein